MLGTVLGHVVLFLHGLSDGILHVHMLPYQSTSKTISKARIKTCICMGSNSHRTWDHKVCGYLISELVRDDHFDKIEDRHQDAEIAHNKIDG